MRMLMFLLFGLFLLSCNKLEKNPNLKSVSKPENPLERELWRWDRKGQEATSEKVLRAKNVWEKKFKKENKASLMKDAGLKDWEELGPFGVGGRIRSIAVDPNNNNHIFIGSVGGGLWETTNGGTNWNPVDDFLPSLSVTQILYDPNDSNILYASTGEGIRILGTGGNSDQQGVGGSSPGIGILKSLDGGNTWNVLPEPIGASDNFFWVNDIAIDPTNSQIIYAVTTHENSIQTGSPVQTFGNAYQSQDGGFTWQRLIGPSSLLASSAMDIKIDPFNSDNVLIGCLNTAYRITNATTGTVTSVNLTTASSDLSSNPRRVEFSYCPSNQNRIYASLGRNGGEVWRSEDGGTTWNQRTSTISPSTDCNSFATSLLAAEWFANTLFVDPSNSNRIIVGSVDLYRSINGGTSFSRITSWCDDINGNDSGGNNSIHADHHAIVPFNNYNGSTNSSVYLGNDGGIYSTNNIWAAGTNSGWASNVGDLAITQFYGGSISSDGNTVIGGAQDNSYSFSIDGGNTWAQPTTGDGAYAAVSYNDDQIIYANLNNNTLFKSTNGGTSFNRIARFRCSTCSSNGSVNNGVFSVNDNATLISLFVMDPNNPDILLAGASRLWRNIDEGDPNDWTVLTSGTSGGRVSAISVDVGNSNRIWVGYSNGNVFRSLDAGATTFDNNDLRPNGSGISLPGSPFVTDIEINPNNSNEVIVSYGGYNTNNLFYTNNGNSANPTWTNINTGIPIQINSVEWHPSNSNWIYVGTDFGVLATEDKGQTWSITPLYTGSGHEGPVSTEVSELFWQPSTASLCAATHGRGIWRTTKPLFDKIYVDKDWNPPFPLPSNGSIAFPYTSFTDALEHAGSGSEIIFRSTGSGDYEEIPSLVQKHIIDKRITITLQNGGNSVILK